MSLSLKARCIVDATEMAQPVETLATKPDDPSSVPKTQMSRERELSQDVLTSNGALGHICTPHINS